MVTKTFAEAQIAILMGGRIAEEIVFDEMSTGAGQDIQSATDMARKMVCEWGMSEEIGPLYYGHREEAIFLGREIAQSQEFSDQTAVKIDAEVSKIVNAQYKRARAIIENNRASLEGLSIELLERESLGGEEIDDVLLSNDATAENGPFRLE
jgi:cell division protease FtsH